MNEKAEKLENEGADGIKTIAKAIGVLRAISLGKSKLTDIAHELHLSKNGVYRLLYSLKQGRMVVQDPVSREYFLGPGIFEITINPQVTHQFLINSAYYDMDDLRQATGETLSLDIEYGMEKIILRRLIGTHNLSYRGRPTPVGYLWNDAMGKILLAQLEPARLEEHLEHVTLFPNTPFTITDKKVFRQEIRAVQQQGYAVSFEESEMGVASLAMPISTYILPASLGILGPEARIRSNLEQYLRLLRQAVERISHRVATG